MTLDQYLAWALGLSLALNAFQLVYWSRVVGTMVDKVMSKNYAEWVQAQGLLNNKPAPLKILLPSEEEAIEDEVLNELNGKFGVR